MQDETVSGFEFLHENMLVFSSFVQKIHSVVFQGKYNGFSQCISFNLHALKLSYYTDAKYIKEENMRKRKNLGGKRRKRQ